MSGPVRVDYQVRTAWGHVVFTSDNPDLAVTWADRHCAPRWALTVDKVETTRTPIHEAARERAAR